MITEVILKEMSNSYSEEVISLKSLKKQVNSLKDSDTLSKARRLESLGFKRSSTVSESLEEKHHKEGMKARMKMEKEIMDYVEKIKKMFPNNKVISYSAFEKVCNKYGLVGMGVDRFKDDVPDKNIQEMENFMTNHPKESLKDLPIVTVGEVEKHNRWVDEHHRHETITSLRVLPDMRCPSDTLYMRKLDNVLT